MERSPLSFRSPSFCHFVFVGFKSRETSGRGICFSFNFGTLGNSGDFGNFPVACCLWPILFPVVELEAVLIQIVVHPA